LRDLRLLWSVLYKEGAWVVIDHNRVDCDAMYGLLGRLCQVEL